MPDPSDPSRLGDDDLAAYRSVLDELHSEISRRAALMRAGGDVPNAGISFGKRVGDGTSIAIQRFEDVAIYGQEMKQLAAVDQAISRLDEGTFGMCTVCGRQLPVERLDVIPWAATCVTCA